MKKFKLDLSEYGVEVDNKKGMIYPIRHNYSEFLRAVGMFKNSAELVDAVTLAKRIRDNSADSIVLDEKEAKVLKAVIDKHLQLTAEGKGCLGGIIHEEAICRVVNMEEITE